jgi:hypothetical protein
MRFGSRSHDVDPERPKPNTRVEAERDHLVRTLRDLADRIDRAPLHRISESVAWLTAGVKPLMGAVERALGRESKS